MDIREETWRSGDGGVGDPRRTGGPGRGGQETWRSRGRRRPFGCPRLSPNSGWGAGEGANALRLPEKSFAVFSQKAATT